MKAQHILDRYREWRATTALILFMGLAPVACAVASDAVSGQITSAGEVEKNKRSIISETVDDESDWKVFTNKTHGFSFRVPASSRVNSHRVSDKSEYVRIQNYRSSDSYGLHAKTYWLEIFIFDHAVKQKIWNPCSELIIDHSVESRDGVKVYQGDPKNVSPDAGGHVRGLCAETDKFDIYMQAAEGGEGPLFLKRIYKSLSFKRK